MKVIVAYSGGKDSQACLLWAVEKYGAKNIEALFCDTGWEHPETYKHIKSTTEQLSVKLVVVKSKKYEGFLDMAHKKGRFPSAKARFCTKHLKSIPMNDYVLSHNEHLVIIQGIRAKESLSRSRMSQQCHYFKYYFEPYNDKGTTFTYRKKDVVAWCEKYNADVVRPVFLWTAQQVIDFILQNGQQPNILYSKGFNRVGCFPCVMARHQDVKSIMKYYPEMLEQLQEAEKSFISRNGRPSSFFVPNYIPKRFTTNKEYPSVEDVVNYLSNNQTDMFDDDNESVSCSSYFGLCE